MEEFTKGPWIAQSGSVCKSSTGMYIAHTDINSTSDDERDANAALIAAAPEMYEILKNICASLNYLEHCELIDEVWELIAKARGEQ